MKNTIQIELEAAKSKMIEEVSFRDITLAKLTRDNVAIVEAMLRNDSAYIDSSKKDASPVGKYGGSSAYWMVKLKQVLLDGKPEGLYSYRKIILGAVEAVDRENSTHLNADKCGRKEITRRLCEFDRSEMVKCLKDPDYEEHEAHSRDCKSNIGKNKGTDQSFFRE